MVFRTLYDRTNSPAEICRKIQKSSPETLNRAAFHAVLMIDLTSFIISSLSQRLNRTQMKRRPAER